jgi:hypothetical protein
MSTIVTRLGKGSPLTNLELDSNFSNLNADKLEISAFNGVANSWLATKNINELLDVQITNPSNGQSLVWNGIANRWENQTISSGSGLEGGSLEIVSAGNATIDSFNTSLYSTVKYLIQATRGTEVHTTEVIVMHNGTNVFTTEYGTILTTQLFDVDAIIVNNVLQLNLVTTSNNTFVDFKRIALTSRLQIIDTGTLEGDLMLLSGSEDLMLGSGVIDLMDGDDLLLEGDLINSSGFEDLMLGSGVVDLMGTTETISLQGDLINLTGSEDLLVGSGVIDLLN